jgi:hypothetical protein
MHGHAISTPGPTTNQCPTCGGSLSDAKYREVQRNLDERERRLRADTEARLKKVLDEKHRLDLIQAQRDGEKRAAEGASKTLAAAKAELTATQAKLKEEQVRAARVQAQQAAEAERKSQAELAKQRQLLGRDKDEALRKARAEFTREKEAAQKKVADLERQLQKKTANDLGDGAEIDLYEALRDTFPRDHLTRVGKGEPGADIHHDVLHKGQSCGLIVIDSKNRKNWQNGYVTKLRQDQLEAEAQHAILATTTFPAGAKELYIRENVIVVTPARAPFIIQLLRDLMVRMHVQGLSMKERAVKMGRLYKYVTSEVCAQRFQEARKITSDLADLDVQETKDHQKVWERRGRMTTRLKGVLRDLDTEISTIVEGTEDEAEESA